eukprot:jgi/Chrzof1/11611/Cz06g02070.t1
MCTACIATAAPVIAPATAADVAKVGSCLLSKCQGAFAQCVGDPQCLENLVCLNACNFSKDETACQIRCGDLYGDKAVETFNACAVSDQKCVPQRVDTDTYPVPPDCAVDRGFDLAAFTGRWYISAGLNPLFDTFDCQEHFFAVPEPGKLVGKLNWRISKPDNDFIDRNTIQTFNQDASNPGILYNHGNEYLHYQDDWYILASKPNDYVFVYYKGTNDAWSGYGGATVYTKTRELDPALIPELSKAAESAGLKWADFKLTDNSCKPHPPKKDLVKAVEDEVERDIENSLVSFGRGFTVVENNLERAVQKDEQIVENELRQAEKLLEQVEREVAAEEQTLLNQLKQFWSRIVRK